MAATITSTARSIDEEYDRFVDARARRAETYESHFDEKIPFFEACLPIEEFARRGPRYPALRPDETVGLTDPRTGRRPVRRGAASAGEPAGRQLQPGRIPEPSASLASRRASCE